jgi:hypothetical protein
MHLINIFYNKDKNIIISLFNNICDCDKKKFPLYFKNNNFHKKEP